MLARPECIICELREIHVGAIPPSLMRIPGHGWNFYTMITNIGDTSKTSRFTEHIYSSHDLVVLSGRLAQGIGLKRSTGHYFRLRRV